MRLSCGVHHVLFVLTTVLMSTGVRCYVPGRVYEKQRIGTQLSETNNNNVDKGFNLLETFGGGIPQGPLVRTVKEGYKLLWQRFMAELAPQSKDGQYVRPSYNFQGWIGSDDDTTFPDEAGRYHVYLGNPCPWCHRVRLVLGIKGIGTDMVGITQLVDDPSKASRGGWILADNDPDPLFTAKDLREVYDRLMPGFRGRCTAPLLVDKVTKQIVSNESADIVRMLNGATFGRSSDSKLDLYPADLSSLIDETNNWIYKDVNNGVYQCGFATTQIAYDEASARVRDGLARCNEILSSSMFLCSNEQITEADVRLLPTILRYDGAYAPLFKAGGVHSRIATDYPYIHQWLQRCWKIPGVAGSIDLAQACGSYYAQLFPLNPGGIVPSPPVNAAMLGLE